MQIYSPPGLAVPGISDAATPPRLVSALDRDELKSDFNAFATYVQGCIVDRHSGADTIYADGLSKAMWGKFVNPTKTNINASTNPNLYDSIKNLYDSLKLQDDLGSDQTIENKSNAYNLYFYVSLYHFVCWYAKNRRFQMPIPAVPTTFMKPRDGRMLESGVRTYVANRLKDRLYQGEISIDAKFFATKEFLKGFEIDGTLEEMVSTNSLGDVAELGTVAYTYLKRGDKYLGKLEDSAPSIALAVKREFIDAFRRTIGEIILHDVRQFLANLNLESSAATTTGTLLAKGFGDYRQFGLGDGTGTKGMFGIPNYGLLFFDYELSDGTFSPPCKRDIPNVVLIDERDPPGTMASLFYFGMDIDYARAIAPRIEVTGCDSGVKRKNADVVFTAETATSHLFSGGTSTRRPGDVSLDAFKATALRATLKSSAGDGPEEMVFIVFKHRIVSADPPAISLASEWRLPDNGYKKTLAEEGLLVFAGQAADLATVVAALRSDHAFTVTSSIEGRGVGRKIDGVTATSRKIKLQRDRDQQADRPLPDPTEYVALRYAHGQVEWRPGANGVGGKLEFDVSGFVSPLRATLKEKLPSAAGDALESLLKTFLPADSQGRTSYNCALSAIRAFFLFDAMIRRIVSLAGTDIDGNNVKSKLENHRDNVAEVRILLPNDRYAARPPLKWSDLDPLK